MGISRGYLEKIIGVGPRCSFPTPPELRDFEKCGGRGFLKNLGYGVWGEANCLESGVKTSGGSWSIAYVIHGTTGVKAPKWGGFFEREY